MDRVDTGLSILIHGSKERLNTMGKCVNHPDRETAYMCTKHNIHLCDVCLRCRDPELYCKFRTSCLIGFMEKSKGKDHDLH